MVSLINIFSADDENSGYESQWQYIKADDMHKPKSYVGNLLVLNQGVFLSFSLQILYPLSS